jgi:hypothetical protein
MAWLRHGGAPTFANRRAACLAGSEIGQRDQRQWPPVAAGATLASVK